MPPTYLGHRYDICEQLSPNLSSTSQASRRQNYFMWTSSADATYSSKTIRSIFYTWNVENCANSICILSISAIHRRCTEDPLERIAKRQLQPATTSQVCRRDMRTRFKTQISSNLLVYTELNICWNVALTRWLWYIVNIRRLRLFFRPDVCKCRKHLSLREIHFALLHWK